MSQGTLRYSGFLGYIRNMWHNEGVFSYWRGNMASIWRTCGNGIMRLGLFHSIKTALFGDSKDQEPDWFVPDDMTLQPDVHVAY